MAAVFALSVQLMAQSMFVSLVLGGRRGALAVSFRS
jgi:hypothetical protein